MGGTKKSVNGGLILGHQVN